MRPRDLLDRARRMLAERKAMEAGGSSRSGWDRLKHTMSIVWVAPDGTETFRETLGEHFARRDGPG